MHGAFGRSSGELAYVVTGPPRDRRLAQGDAVAVQAR
jgi:hypothetical protein